jgi:thiamine-phosphate pyrophosphorylase
VDARLVGWAHAVAARGGSAQRLPKLWLFTDARRLPDPRAAARRLPCGLAGIVLRHDGEPDREALGRDLARICRGRRLVLVVAGDARLAAALRAGIHLRSGRWPDRVRPPRTRNGKQLITSSAHDATDLRRAARAGASLAFLSPVFATASHPATAPLGPVRWARLARTARLPVAALGGIDGARIRSLPATVCMAIGSIGALA